MSRKPFIMVDPEMFFENKSRRGMSRRSPEGWTLTELLEARNYLKDYDKKIEEEINKKKEDEKKKAKEKNQLSVFELSLIMMVLAPFVAGAQLAVVMTVWNAVRPILN